MNSLLLTTIGVLLICWVFVASDMSRHPRRMNAVNLIGLVILPFIWPLLYILINYVIHQRNYR